MYISATEYVSSYKMRTELQAKLRKRRLRTDEDDSQVPNDAVAREEFTLSARGKYLKLAEVSKHGKVAWRLSSGSSAICRAGLYPSGTIQYISDIH